MRPSAGMRASHKFIDRLRLCVRGGQGGLGCVAWEPNPGARSGFAKRASGGSGGRGGDVIVRASMSVDSLSSKQGRVLRAGGGENGLNRSQQGGRGCDAVIEVPCGTVVRIKAGESWANEELSKETEVHNLILAGSSVRVAVGGMGGLGNSVTTELKWKKGRPERGATFGHIEGKEGEARLVELELQTIADVGLIGKPNAGKSSLLRALSNAEPKIADYPFTTLRPNVGCCEFVCRRGDAVVDRDVVRIADVPGLIQGASDGRGLGLDFLRHVARTNGLVVVVDASSGSSTALEDLAVICAEIAAACPEQGTTLQRPAILFANKLDLVEDPRDVLADLKAAIRKRDFNGSGFLSATFVDVLGGSALTGLHIPHLVSYPRPLMV